ncbi:MAG: glycosyltransferase family 39 protein [Ardenticatenaceae bacterium]|nr:glycosyltransferase family 39 protein [Ardenticatenaceae bacterium]
MTAWIVILLISGTAFLQGWLILRQFFTEQRPFTGTHLEAGFASLTLGLLTMGWLAFVLAELGWFSILTLALLWAGLSFLLALRLYRHGFSGRLAISPTQVKRLFASLPDWVEWLALGLWLVAAVYLFGRPHQFIIGGADAGVYVNLSAEIAENGRITIQDDFLASIPANLYPALLRSQKNDIAPYYILPAFFVTGKPAGEITPQFYHLYPVWQAVAYGLGNPNSGIQAALLMPGLWALLGALTLYLTVRRMAGWETGLLALAGLSLNALQIWFARYPTTETMTQFLLWAGFWSLGIWLKSPKDRFWGLLAGLALGQSFLVRIDMLFVLPVLGLLGIWLWVHDGWKREYNWFFLPLLLLVLHSLLHALWQSRPYFFDLFGFALRLLRNNWIIPIGAGIASIALLLGLARFRTHLMRMARFQRQFLIILVVGFVVWGLYNWLARPYLHEAVFWNDPYSQTAIPQFNHENLLRLGWYLSPIGIGLGIVGIGLLIWHVNRETAVMLSISLLISLIYITNIHANPHQIYAMRRYVPAVMPLFIVGGAYLLGWLLARQKIWLSGLSLALALVWLGGFGWLARGFISQVDYQGILPQLDQLTDQLAPDSILIFNDSSPIGQGDIIGTPLRFLKGYDVLTLRDPEALDQEAFDELLLQWQAQGHRIYWITVQGGYNWPIPGWTQEVIGSYDIQTSVLEGNYYQRPTAVTAVQWQGQITELTIE